MPKQLPITGEVRAKLAKVLGDDADFSHLAVFETIVVDDQPVNAGGLFNKAVIKPSVLQAMADQIEGDNYVPLHTLHQHGREIPVGRFFAGQTHKAVDSTGKETNQLRSLFYIPTDTEEGAVYASKVRNGVLLDVSLGMQPKAAVCSKCGFDYMGPEASFFNIFFEECNEEHVIGQGGTHLVITELESLYEISLVSNGASEAAKIQDRAESIYAREHSPFHSIAAASGVSSPLLVMSACRNKPTASTENTMKLKKAELAAIKDKLATKGAKFATAESLTVLLAKLDVDTLEADTVADIRATFSEELDKLENPPVVEEENADAAADDAAGDSEEQENADAAADDAAGDSEEQAGEGELKAGITLDQFIELSTDKKLAEREVVRLTAQVAEMEPLKASLAQAEKDNVELKKSVEQMTAHLQADCKALLIASGKTKPEVPTSVSELLSTITSVKASLAGKLPLGGVGTPAQVETEVPRANLGAFITKK